MNIQQLSDQAHLVSVLPPVAGFQTGGSSTKAVALKKYENAHFMLQTGAGATGTFTIIAEACSDVNGTGATAIPYKYSKQVSDCTTADTWVASQDVAAAGINTTAGANQLHVVDVLAKSLPDGLPFVRLRFVEVVASPVTAGVSVLLTEPKYNQRPQLSAIV